MDIRDVTIIGAGPVGLFAIFECGMMGLKCHVIDALDMVGGQCMALYPEKPIYDIPAYPKVSGEELITQLKKQADPFHPTYHLGQQVTHITQKDDLWELTTSQNTILYSKTMIIAAGVGAFGPNRPPLENLDLYEGKSVFYFVKNREDFRDKRIVIAGGGDSAVDWALSLHDVAKSVTIVHRRSKFRAAPESEKRLHDLVHKKHIELAVPYQLSALEGRDGKLTSVIVENLDGHKKAIPADALLPFYGLAMNLGPIATWGLGLDKNHIVVDQGTMATNTPGIYAIGDIATYNHKLKLILCGFAEAAQAAHHIRSYLNPHNVYHFEYSTTTGVKLL